MEAIPVYYFGHVRKDRSQILCGPDMVYIPNLKEPQFPFSWEMLFGDFCHTEKRDIGHLTLIQVYGWTIISFWDNTFSSTFMPNSASFIAPGIHSAVDMIDLALKHFPEVYHRVMPILHYQGSN